jgi:hypothetical protein
VRRAAALAAAPAAHGKVRKRTIHHKSHLPQTRFLRAGKGAGFPSIDSPRPQRRIPVPVHRALAARGAIGAIRLPAGRAFKGV